MAANKKPAISLHSQGIVDDIIKLGAKGVRAAVRTTRANKQFAKKLPPMATTLKKDAFGMRELTKQKMKNQGALSHKESIVGLAREKAKAKAAARPPEPPTWVKSDPMTRRNVGKANPMGKPPEPPRSIGPVRPTRKKK